MKMTKRQKALNVTEYGYQRGIVKEEFLADNEAFLAKASTIAKGQYNGLTICKKWFGDCAGEAKLEQIKPFLFGLTAIMPEHFNYSDTHGLDCLTVK